MKGLRLAALALFLVPLLASATSAQESRWTEHLVFRQEMEQMSRNGQLRNPLVFVHLSCAEGNQEQDPPPDCQPVVRLFVKETDAANYRLPAQTPRLITTNARLRIDKQRLKQEKGDPTLLTQACSELPEPDVCDDRWHLKQVWTVDRLSEEDVNVNLQTTLVKPGVTSHQLGAETATQTAALRIPVAAARDGGVLIPLWEQNGYLFVPMTFSPQK
jgi:hypothetical protein